MIQRGRQLIHSKWLSKPQIDDLRRELGLVRSQAPHAKHLTGPCQPPRSCSSKTAAGVSLPMPTALPEIGNVVPDDNPTSSDHALGQDTAALPGTTSHVSEKSVSIDERTSSMDLDSDLESEDEGDTDVTTPEAEAIGVMPVNDSSSMKTSVHLGAVHTTLDLPGPQTLYEGDYIGNRPKHTHQHLELVFDSIMGLSTRPAERFQVPLCEEPYEVQSPWLCARSYAPSKAVFSLYRLAIGLSNSIDGISELTGRLNCMANVLHLLAASDQAFDLYLIVCCLFRNHRHRGQAPHPHFVLAAINCARTAKTLQQACVARLLVVNAVRLLEQCFTIEELRHTQTWRALKLARSFHAMAQVGYRDVLSAARPEDLAYWMANAMLLSHQEHIEPSANLPDYGLLYLGANSLQHLFVCPITHQSIQNALCHLEDFAQSHGTILDLMFDHLQLRTYRCVQTDRVAQVIVCWLVRVAADKCKLPQIGFSSTDMTAGCLSHGGFPCDLNGQTILVIPFILIDRIERLMGDQIIASTLGGNADSNYSSSLLGAVRQTRASISTDDTAYEDLIRRFVNHMRCPVNKAARTESVSVVDGIQSIATAIAGIKTESELLDALPQAPLPRTPTSTDSPPDERDGHSALSNLRRIWSSPETTIPTLAPSPRTSFSSDRQSFRRLASRMSTALSVRPSATRSSAGLSWRSSWSFLHTSGFPRYTSTSDVSMIDQ